MQLRGAHDRLTERPSHCAAHEYDCKLHVVDHIKHTHADLYFILTCLRRWEHLAAARQAAIAAGAAKSPLTIEEGAATLGLDAKPTEILKTVHEMQEDGLVDELDHRLGSAVPTVDWWSRDVAFERDVSWWNKKPVSAQVAGFACRVYNMKNLRVRVDMSPAVWPERKAALKERRAAAAAGRERSESTASEGLKTAMSQVGALLGLKGSDAEGTVGHQAAQLAQQLEAAAGPAYSGTWLDALGGALQAASEAQRGTDDAEDAAAVAALLQSRDADADADGLRGAAAMAAASGSTLVQRAS